MKFKRILTLLLTVLLLFSLTACGMDRQTVDDLLDTAGTILDETTDQVQSPEDAAPEEIPEAPPTEETPADVPSEDAAPAETIPDESGVYTTKDDVALYLYTYHHLPDNFITKKEAQALGWPGGSLEPYAPGKCIGGDRFGNREGLLPQADGRTYTECDINTLGADSRGAERLVFSNDGLIYYTDDHYESFTLLYGEAPS